MITLTLRLRHVDGLHFCLELLLVLPLLLVHPVFHERLHAFGERGRLKGNGVGFFITRVSAVMAAEFDYVVAKGAKTEWPGVLERYDVFQRFIKVLLLECRLNNVLFKTITFKFVAKPVHEEVDFVVLVAGAFVVIGYLSPKIPQVFLKQASHSILLYSERHLSQSVFEVEDQHSLLILP